MKPTARRLPQACLAYLDHFTVWTRDGQLVVFDDPYLPSCHLHDEAVLLRKGWRIRHLPTSQSLWVAGKCQPRLLAPLGSRVDLDQIAELMRVAQFRGCFSQTEKFCEADTNVRQRLAAEEACK
ncbi:MAG: hypothetical protein ABMA14_05870 [Hyphomonadaceae bacterium]